MITFRVKLLSNQLNQFFCFRPWKKAQIIEQCSIAENRNLRGMKTGTRILSKRSLNSHSWRIYCTGIRLILQSHIDSIVFIWSSVSLKFFSSSPRTSLSFFLCRTWANMSSRLFSASDIFSSWSFLRRKFHENFIDFYEKCKQTLIASRKLHRLSLSSDKPG